MFFRGGVQTSLIAEAAGSISTSLEITCEEIDSLERNIHWYFSDETKWRINGIEITSDGEQVDFTYEDLTFTYNGKKVNSPAEVYDGKNFDYEIVVSYQDASAVINAKIGQRGDANCNHKVNIRDSAIISYDLAQLYSTKKTTLTKEDGFGVFLANIDYDYDTESGLNNRNRYSAYGIYDLNVRDVATIATEIVEGKIQISRETSEQGNGNEAISLSSAEGEPGETVTLLVNVECNNNFESADFEISWAEPNLTSKAAVSSVHDMISQSSVSNNSNRIAVYQLGTTAVADGTIASIDFTIPADAEPGTVYDIGFSEINTFAVFDGSDIADYLNVTGGAITVIEKSTPDNPDYNGTPTLSLSSVSGMPGETVTVAVQALAGNQLQGTELAIDYNSGLTPASDLYGDYVVAWESTVDIASAVILSLNPIPDGDIAYIDFTIPADAEPGTVYDIGFSKINTFALFDGSDIYDSVMAVGGTITVLDNSENPDDLTYGNLKYRIVDASEDYIEITGCDESETDVVIPNEIEGLPVKSIADGALSLLSIKTIYIPESVEFISTNPCIVWDAIDPLMSINVAEENKNFCSVDGILFNKDKTKIIAYPQGKEDTEYEIPDTVETIGSDAFVGCLNLKNIKIPGSVRVIEDRAFEECDGIETMIIPEGVETVGDEIFFHSDGNLESVEFASSVKSVGTMMFIYTQVSKAVFLNPECEFPEDLICNSGEIFTIYGYKNSTAQIYAEKYGYKFRLIDEPNGDANGDGKVNVRDAAEIARKIAQGKKDELPESADYNKDGKVNVRDAAAIARDLANGLL